ncbi:hypothetical protein PSN45_004223 [Yamadazyma tenuis]|uniref:Amino acid permease/ SLC12A domain-containing protein n=1 Tax=Candida tenuis (strain ATCC 10573 / BCRC 21748 / CBS 615 / JCM 9827 / NBRC 10315 / NRRL Y-1498 / VKM Y-70) TaxID=590646 RepID=G3B6L2_CANTC|nr:uncharacterized protein CANTEDRAFT_114800 [Yamadazyma tenuis ATCC 10573]EGV63496.1 hypothetical protein CANTEDRAFT_114800 [Yamadazyma tenuis ATCC 10573]WEJ96680.1 hypothetical protein PSN45_004223 [Yamadazyma tenuis]
MATEKPESLKSLESSSSVTSGRKKFDPVTGVKRGLKTRHISMMALAGIIGPGAFLGLSRALNNGGPVGLLVGFSIVGILVVVMMFSIGELNSMFDFNFNSHAARWVDPAFGAALGWNYAFLWVCTLISEYVAVTSTLQFYSEKVPIYGYYLILWFCFSLYQMLGVDVFGEVEYILALVKIVFISGFYLFAIISAAGGIKGHSPGNPFRDYPLAHGFKGIAKSFVYAAQFYVGVESLSVTFTESRNVRKAVKRAVSQSIFRIFYIYFGLSIAYGITVPWNDPALSDGSAILNSVMTIALVKAGWKNAGYYVTTVILVTCVSSINSAVYFCARCIMRLSVEGYAPKVLAKVNKNGVPWVACNLVHLFGFISLLSMDSTSSVAYGYIVGLSGVSAFIVWTGIIFTHFKFRKGWLQQGNSASDLPFKAPFYPYSNYLGIFVGIFLCLVQGWTVFVPFQAGQFVDLYIMLPLFPIFYLIFKFWKKTKWIRSEDMDFETNRIDHEVEVGEKNEDATETVVEVPSKKQKISKLIWNYF